MRAFSNNRAKRLRMEKRMTDIQHVLPEEIEKTSFQIIERELGERGRSLPEEHRHILLRVIHTTADFDYIDTMTFSEGAAEKAADAIRRGAHIVTDTNMALAGVSKTALKKLGGEAHCFMAEPEIAEIARARGSTRAVASMDFAAAHLPEAIFAVGNAPTALFALTEQMEKGLRPALIVAVPVGFVNVVESKERVLDVCRKAGVPAIVALGRKGGSTVSAAILNALCYEAVDMTDPARRGWD